MLVKHVFSGIQEESLSLNRFRRRENGTPGSSRQHGRERTSYAERMRYTVKCLVIACRLNDESARTKHVLQIW